MTRSHRQPDYALAALIGILILFGLVMLASAGSFIGIQRYDDGYYFVKKQAISLVVGLIVGFVLYRIDYQRWWKWAVPFFIASLVGLFIVFLPGIGSLFLGARRWIHIGPAVFQPSEIMKLSLIVYLAAWFSQRERRLSDFQEGLIPFLVTLGSVAGLIILQPDLGTTMVIVLVGTVMFFVAGGATRHLASMVVIGVALLAIIIVVAPYRADRFTVFLNPNLDPQGIGYHIKQSALAIGSGGMFGLGLGHSRQKYNYLPEPAGDSIFAIMAEELGFIMVIFFVLTWLVVIFRGIAIARGAPDTFGKLLATGITAWLGLQAFVNMAALSGIAPLTGIPLPFMSHGGSSLIMNVAAVGILLNISTQSKRA